MGKANKRPKQNHTNHHDNPIRARSTVVRRQHSQQKTNPIKNKIPSHPQQHGKAQLPRHSHQNQQQKLKVLFTKSDRVLLIGEGDFSFAASLARNHEVSSITATCFDTQPVLDGKHPGAKRRLEKLNAKVPQHDNILKVMKGIDPLDPQPNESEWDGFSSSSSSEADSVDQDDEQLHPKKHREVVVLYGIDATKLATTHKKVLRPHAPFTKIVFNFPHVGGLSTDVNRQVRANQQLLVGFFGAAKTLLATSSNPVRRTQAPLYDPDQYLSDHDESGDDDDDDDDHHHHHPAENANSRILVTLFEGEPYTLWNVRDLARHSGLKVVESFRFPWSAYPGYKHARTTGDIITGKDRGDEGKRKGAWRGEERDARCYVLELKDQDGGGQKGDDGTRKRKKVGHDSDSD